MAGVELGSAFVEIRATQDQLKKDLDSAHANIAGKLGGAMAAAAKAVAAAGLVAGGAIAAIGVTALQAASDANESLSKVGVVFGDNAADIEAWAATAATSFGQSRAEALAAAGTLGNLFVSMGLGSKDAAGLSTEMIELAGDLASFNNISPTEALDKLRAGLVGEAEPLRALGVNMNAAAVEAEGMRLGLETVGGELTEAAKVQARYSLIMQQTQTAQGDFARTSDGMANAMRIIRASVSDLQVAIGNQLLPVIAPLIASFSQWLPGAIEEAQPHLEAIRTAAERLMAGAAQLSERVGELATRFQQDVLPVLQRVVSAIQDNLGPILAGAAAILVGVVIPVIQAWATAAKIAAAAQIAAFGPVLIPLAAIGAAVFLMKKAWDTNFGDIQGKTAAVWAVVEPILQNVYAELARFWEEIQPLLTSAWENIQATTQTVMKVVGAVVETVMGALSAFWAEHWQEISAILSAVWTIIEAVVQTAWAAVQGYIIAGLQILSGDWAGAWETIKTTLSTVWAGIGTIVQAGLDALRAYLSILTNIVGDLVAPVLAKAAEIGTAITSGISNALTATWNGLVQKLAGLVDLLPATVRAILGIASPSRVFVEIGEQVGEGFAEGLESIAGALDAVLPQVKDLVAQAQEDINKSIDEEDRKAKRDRELEEIKHGRRIAALQAELGTAKATERKKIEARIEEAHQAHTQRLEDLERSHLDRVVELEYDAAEKIADARRKQQEQTGAALLEFGRGFAAATRDLQAKADALGRRIRDAMQSAGEDAAKATKDAWDRANASMEQAAEGIANSRFLRGIRDAFSARQDLAALTHSREREDEEKTHQRTLDLAELEYRREQDLGKSKRTFDKRIAEDITDDERRELQKQYDAERDSIRLRFEEAKADMLRRQQLEDEAIKRRRDLEEQERAWRKGQEEERRAFEDDLENKALYKSMARMAEERDARIREIQAALTEKQAKIEEQEREERAALTASYEEKVSDLRESLIAKLPALLGEAQGELTTFLDGIAAQVSATSAKIIADATASAMAMANMGGGDSSQNVINAITTTLDAITATGGDVSPQLGAQLLHAGTVASGIGPGGQVGTGIVGAQSMTIELDGIAVGKAVAPYVEPEITRFGGSRIHGV